MPASHLPPHQPQAWFWNLPMDHHHHQVEREEGSSSSEREHMFEKPLTPSDVGKLNRLVIPKQYAEKYFPLDGDSGEKGLLLSFEDESGKAWRFRYSYWTSSQSYVLTKGWSRFVKEKRLDAGDIVLFERRRTDGDRLYIGWKRRGAHAATGGANFAAGSWNHPVFSARSYPTDQSASSYLYITSMQQGCILHAGGEERGGGGVERPEAPANSKRLRLFGVNLDCGPDRDEPEPTFPIPCLMGQVQFMPAGRSGSQL